MRTLALNIETCGQAAKLAELPEPEAALGNLKDPAKIEAKIAEVRHGQHKGMALDPFFGEVLWITIVEMDGGNPVIVNLAGGRGVEYEREIITTTHGMIVGQNSEYENRVVTFNGAGFDFPFLERRGQLLRASTIGGWPEQGKYRCAGLANPHVDLMQYLHQSSPGFGDSNPLRYPRTLSFYVKQFLGVDFPFADLDQSTLGELAKTDAGRDVVRGLCEWNTVHTLRLYERLVGL